MFFEEDEDLLGAASYDHRDYPGNSTRQPRDDLARRQFFLIAVISITRVILWYCQNAAIEEGLDLSFL